MNHIAAKCKDFIDMRPLAGWTGLAPEEKEGPSRRSSPSGAAAVFRIKPGVA